MTKLQGKTLAVVNYPRHAFVDFKAGNAAFGLIGALAAQGQGESLVEQYGLEDPAARMSELLSQRLEADRGMRLQPIAEGVAASDDIAQLIRSRPGADYILDIQTTSWGTIYLPTNWTRYRVMYGARMRLIDTHSGAVIAQQGCNSVQVQDEPDPPSKDELLADDARELKRRTSRGAAECLKVFSGNALKLPVAWLARHTLDEEQQWQEEGAAGTASPAPAPAGTLSAGPWRATMHCEHDNRPNVVRGNPYNRQYEVDVSHLPVIRLHQRNKINEEKLAGRLVDGRLALRGEGFRLENPAVRWSLRFSGTFNQDGSRWEGQGSVLMRNSEIRACRLVLRKS